ncbi:MAG TPA: DUF3152 domain-containing protein [Verrucomicrobiae bacterium]|nr:DUF3152 domain-containing protein [Verrucomicrobiae bacterium]
MRLRLIAKNRKFVLIFGAFLAYFVLINVVAYLFFNARAFPRTTIDGQKVGGKSFSQIEKTLQAKTLGHDTLTLNHQDKHEQLPLKSIDAKVDAPATIARLKSERSWLPISNVLKKHTLETSVSMDSAKVEAEANRLATAFSRPVTDAKIVLQNNIFTLVPAQDGVTAQKDTIKQALTHALQNGQQNVTLQLRTVEPQKKTKDLEPAQQSLQKQQNTSITITYQQKSHTVTPPDIGGWYSPQGDAFTLNRDLVKAYIQKRGAAWGIVVDNSDAAADQVSKAIAAGQKVSVGLVARKAARHYTYCVATRGVDNAYLGEFGSKFAATLADARGWSVGGLVTFSQASSGCNFTAWLTAPDQMPSFGAICDAMWSCRVGSNVVINFDRWRFASPAWNASGGSLEDYRFMVINHETGHWFGFDHSNCGGAGQAAPVMQQQSIALNGCVFNPWPLPGETAALKQRLGI